MTARRAEEEAGAVEELQRRVEVALDRGVVRGEVERDAVAVGKHEYAFERERGEQPLAVGWRTLAADRADAHRDLGSLDHDAHADSVAGNAREDGFEERVGDGLFTLIDRKIAERGEQAIEPSAR